MTPTELLDLAIEDNRNPTLFYDDPVGLRSLLLKSLGKYQDRAGCIQAFKTPLVDGEYQLEVDKPDLFHSIVSVLDSNGFWTESSESDDGTQIVVVPKCISKPPFTISYFVDLRSLDIPLYLEKWAVDIEYEAKKYAVINSEGESFVCVADHLSVTEPLIATYDVAQWKIYNQVPKEAVGLILDYLTALIRQKNVPRARAAMKASGINADDLPDDASLKEAIEAIEEKMSANIAIIPMTTVYQ